MAIWSSLMFAVLAFAGADSGSEIVPDGTCTDPGACQEKHALMQQTKVRSVLTADASLEEEVDDVEKVNAKQEPFEFWKNEGHPTTTAAEWAAMTRAAENSMNKKIYGPLSKQINWAARQFLKLKHVICQRENIADFMARIDKDISEWNPSLDDFVPGMGGGAVGAYVQTNASVEQGPASHRYKVRQGAQCGDAGRLPHLPYRCNTLVAWIYCTASKAECTEKVADVVVNWALVASFVIPQAKILKGAVVAARTAGGSVTKMAATFVKKAVQDTVKKLKKQFKKDVKDFMLKKLESHALPFEAKAAELLTEKQMDEIIEGGLEIVAAMGMSANADHDVAAFAVEFVEAVEPTGIVEAMKSLDEEDCEEMQLEDMPLDGLVCDERLSGPQSTGGDDYRGCQTKTTSGHTCLEWTSSKAVQNGIVPSKPQYSAKGLGNHNFCRNPNGHSTIWCFIKDPPNWGACKPKDACDETLSGTNHVDYRGCQTKTTSGHTCQEWTSSVAARKYGIVPSNPQYFGKGLGNHNFCRNPNGHSTIWCSINSPPYWGACKPLARNGPRPVPRRRRTYRAGHGGKQSWLTQTAPSRKEPPSWWKGELVDADSVEAPTLPA